MQRPDLLRIVFLNLLEFTLFTAPIWSQAIPADQDKKQDSRASSNFEERYRRGSLEYSRGNYYDAVIALREAEAIEANASVLKLLAMSYHGAHQNRLFLLKMNEALHKNPADFAPYYYIGEYFESDVNDFFKAAEYFSRAIERAPLEYRSHYHLGYCFEMQSSPERAETEYRRSIELAARAQSRFEMPYAGLARLRLSQNLPVEAMEFARQAIKYEPKDPGNHELVAKVYAERGDFAEAAAEWKLSSDLDPTRSVPLYRLYRAYLSLGEGTKAEAALRKYRKIASLYGTN